MSLAHIIILLVTGAVAGFAGGLLGLGGAFLMTPMQYMVYTDMGLSADVAIKMAFGTSLLVVLTTAVSGAWRHHHERAIIWRVAVTMGICSLVFALVGATLASHVPGSALKIVFGVIAILSGIRMFFATRERSQGELVSNPWVWVVWAIPVGLLSGILGVGGGVLMIPIMVLALRLKMHNAVANSLAIMIFTSIGGIIGYIINGIGVVDRLSYSLGYIHLPSWLLLAIPGAGMAQVGAILSHRVHGKSLMYIFIIVLFYMGLRMIGVFEWLGWPI
jgi:uncharacterized membrane protein YfcA